MISPNKINSEACEGQVLCINKESANECWQEQEQYNYLPQQIYQQQNSFSFEPLLQNQQQQQKIQLSQNQTQVQVYPNSDQQNDQNFQLYNTGQKRVFALSVVSLWTLQIIIELLIVIKWEFLVKNNFLYYFFPCFFVATLIFAYVLYNNYPINIMKKVRILDKILFILYFMADVFTNFVIYFFMNNSLMFCVTMRLSQVCNLISSFFPLWIARKNLQIRYFLIFTLIPFTLMIIFSIQIDQLLNTWVFYFITFALQLLQILLSLNLIRVLNGIYRKQNKKIDINNIYTGFILFKWSYYIPF